MNTFGWRLRWTDQYIYLALHGHTALMADAHHTGQVWQYGREQWGLKPANDWLVGRTTFFEGEGWRLEDEPVEFDLTDEAIACIRATSSGEWLYAQPLRDELVAAIKAPPIISGHMVWHATAPPASPAVATMHFDPSTGAVKVFNGTTWSELGTVNAKTLGIEMTPYERGTITE